MQRWNTISVQAAAVHKVTAWVWENTTLTSHLKAKHTGRQRRGRQDWWRVRRKGRLNWAGEIYPYFTFLHHLLLYYMSTQTRAFYGMKVRVWWVHLSKNKQKRERKKFHDISDSSNALYNPNTQRNLDKRTLGIQNNTGQHMRNLSVILFTLILMHFLPHEYLMKWVQTKAI